MEITLWFWVWFALAIFFSVAEVFTVSFFMLPFAIGAVGAEASQLFGVPLAGQVIVFFALSVLSLLIVRPFAKKVTQKSPTSSSGIDRILNKEGVLIRPITPDEPFGRLHILGEDWLCAADDGVSSFEVGQPALVVRVDGTKAMIRHVTN